MTKGFLELRRTVPDVGVIRVPVGTHSKRQLARYEAMVAQLREAGRLDYLRLLRDGVVSPGLMYDRVRGRADYALLPAPIVEPLLDTVFRFLEHFEASDAHFKNVMNYCLRLTADAPEGATAEDVPAILRELRPRLRHQPDTFNHFRNAARALLAETIGTRTGAYEQVADMKPLLVSERREGNPQTPVQAFDLAAMLGEDLGACWLTACLTGMGRKEYAGAWEMEQGHLRIHGTKREGRNRLVPLIALPVVLPCSPRYLHERIVKVTGGLVELYDARRTFLKWTEQAGIIPTHQDCYAGHGPRSMTELYKRGNVAPYLDQDAERFHNFLRNSLETAGRDAGKAFAILTLLVGEAVATEDDAPRRSRTPNLLIRSKSPIARRKGKYRPRKREAGAQTGRSGPETVNGMRGRVRGVSRATHRRMLFHAFGLTKAVNR